MLMDSLMLIMCIVKLYFYFPDLGFFKLLLGAEKAEAKVKEAEETSHGESI